MKREKSANITIVCLAAIFILTSLILLSGCTREEKKEEVKEGVIGLVEEGRTMEYTPLTKEKWAEIRLGNASFSTIEMTLTVEDQPEDVKNLLKSTWEFSLKGGTPGGNQQLISLTQYNGFLVEPGKDPSVAQEADRQTSFSADDVNSIYDLLETYPSYFFDNEEFTDRPLPIKTDKAHIGLGDYCFTLAVFESGSKNKAWVISKNTDEPKPMIEELLSLIKDEFLDNFNTLPPAV
jgi:hypothetical protein